MLVGDIYANTHTHIGNINSFRYRNYYYDIEIGMYYLKTRYYDPQVGRFINADDVRYLDSQTIGGLNLYAYCLNNPITYTDPSGKFVFSLSIFLGAVITTALIGAGVGGYIAHQNEDNIWAGIAIGFAMGAIAGAAAYFGTGLIVGGFGLTAATTTTATAGSVWTGIGVSTVFGFMAGFSNVALNDVANNREINWGKAVRMGIVAGALNLLGAFKGVPIDAIGQATKEAIGSQIFLNSVVTYLTNLITIFF